MINLIWAMDEDNLIGNNDKMPWHCKEDLIYFKSKTAGKAVLLGYNNYVSLMGYYKDKPLPYGKVYLLTRKDIEIPGVSVIHDFKEAMKEEELWVIGGGMVYELMLPYADNLYVTYIKGHHEGNVYFPHVDFSKYDISSDRTTEFARYVVYKKRG